MSTSGVKLKQNNSTHKETSDNKGTPEDAIQIELKIEP